MRCSTICGHTDTFVEYHTRHRILSHLRLTQTSFNPMPYGHREPKAKKEKEPEYQYTQARYHPVEEFLVTATEKLTSETPSFVLEVTWPRVALFYHSASPLCVQLRDRYVSVAREVRRRSIREPVEFWAINCEVHRDACEDLGIIAVPRLLGFPQGSIEGKLIQRTMNNNIEIEEVVNVLNVNLKEVDEAEEALKLLQDENERNKMKEYQLNNKNDPNKLHIGEIDHMREILHPHSELSDVCSDAMESFLHSIHSNIKQSRDGEVVPWSFDRLQIFREWLDLMHWTLPTRDMALIHNVINDFRNNFQVIEGSIEEVTRILKSHDYYKHPRKWSTSCAANNPEDLGFGCGFWKLLHIMSVGVAEQHGAVMGDLDRIVVGHNMGVVQDYVNEFGFANNRKAGENVVASYSACQKSESCRQDMGLEKKGLLSRFRKKIPITTDPSWRNLAIWLWQAHQSYRIERLRQTKEGYDSLLDSEEVQWPPAALCPKCYASGTIVDPDDHKIFLFSQDIVRDAVNDITWNKQRVYEHLKREYWPNTLQSPRVVVISRLTTRKRLAELKDRVHSSGWSIVSLLLLAVAMCMALNFSMVRRYLAGFSGRHKKMEYYLEDGEGKEDEDDDSYWKEWSNKSPEKCDIQPFVRPRRRAGSGGQSRFRPLQAFLDD